MIAHHFHHGEPPKCTAQMRRHTKHGKTYMPLKVKQAKAWYHAVTEAHAPAKPVAGAVIVDMIWTFHDETLDHCTKKPDLDNAAKLAIDAMTDAGYWLDDKQIVDLRLRKAQGPFAGFFFSVALAPPFGPLGCC